MRKTLGAAIAGGGSIGQKQAREIGPVKLLACADIAIGKAAQTEVVLSLFYAENRKLLR